MIGTGNDLDEPGYVQSRDPETGDVQWTFYTVPMKKGDPGLETWGSLDGAQTRRGQRVDSRLYDPETHLYIFGTGQSIAGLHQSAEPRGRQPLHVLDRRDERGYRQDGLVLPGESARHARLGFHRNTDPGRRRVQRQAAQDGAARRPQRLLLHVWIA